MQTLADKRVLITGAGHGLGRELALAFAAAGAKLIVTDLMAERMAETLSLVGGADGRAAGYALDVTDNAMIGDVRDRVHREQGPIDVLVNNAGVAFGGTFLDVPLEKHHATYHVNLLGQVAMAHTFLPDLIARAEGHLVHVASASGLIALPYATTYASSKWGVLGFSESIREELRLLGHRHVAVTAVCPSYIDTGMAAGVRVPLLSRMLKADEVARLVVRAVRKRQELVLTPWLVKITPFSRGVLPPSWFRRTCDWLGITGSMSTWHGHNPPSGEGRGE
ncbi:MAG TPA: SDR family NAD(P)-dependent oxidoreductase [Pirellulales bacterium]|nr:SDR family NAD(P)-dependent oxidoreductase [Pirellulales bacterium]